MLRKLADQSPGDAEDLLTGSWGIKKPEDGQQCQNIVKWLAGLVSLSKDDREQPPAELTAPTPSTGRSSLAPLLRNLFSTISKYCRCACKEPHTAMLPLFTYSRLPKDFDPNCCFTMFLSRRLPCNSGPWQEMGVTIQKLAQYLNILYMYGICAHF